MTKIFFYNDGTPSPHPIDRASAVKLRKSKYNDRQICPVCNECSIKYTLDDRCIHCARLESMYFYNAVACYEPLPEGVAITEDMRQAKAAYHASEYFPHPTSPSEAVEKNSPVWLRVEPCSKAGHIGLRSVNGGCWFCEQGQDTNAARIAARHAGERWYTPTTPCAECGTTALRNVRTNKCRGCLVSSPRQAAKAAGEKWYTPTTPCPKCDTLEPRRVDNGECRGCIPRSETTLEREATAAMVRDCPDMVMSRKDARALGLKIYRTGKACSNGHTEYRYVSTGGCLACLGVVDAPVNIG